MTNKEAIEEIKKDLCLSERWSFMCGECPGDCQDCELSEALHLAIKALKNERPTGEWIEAHINSLGGFVYYSYRCSNCKKEYKGEYNYCPNCGAQMIEEGGENET